MAHTATHPPTVSQLEAFFEPLHLPRLQGSVLVVEDEAFVREVTGEILAAAGYHVIKARSAAEAMVSFRQCNGKIDLLVTDLVLPGQNGRVLARELTALSPNLKTLFMSGYPDHVVARTCRGEATGTYLAKPFSVESLMRKIQEVLRESPGAARE